MPYNGSYVWKIRQKIGHDLLVLPTADVVAVRDNGDVLCVYNKDFNAWVFPGGYAEENQTSDECAARELLEEGGLAAGPKSLEPFAFLSGATVHYKNGDVTQPFTQAFIARKWKDNGDELDDIEVAERKWFSIATLRSMEGNAYLLTILDAYEAYLKTGKYQMVSLKEDT